MLLIFAVALIQYTFKLLKAQFKTISFKTNFDSN